MLTAGSPHFPRMMEQITLVLAATADDEFTVRDSTGLRVMRRAA